MLYVLFFVLAIGYNLYKFRKERGAFLSSLIDARHSSHREMILGHHFYVFIFEVFLASIVAHLVTEKSSVIGILGLGTFYICLVFIGFYVYRFFIRYVERKTELELYEAFKNHLVKELRVNFAVIMLPILIYSLINWAFQDSVYEEWGSFWFFGLLFNIVLVSVLTIVCSVIIMLRLIPNREISEPEYLELINRRLEQIQQPHMRIRWIESDIKNAFVVGLKLLSFSNQTMFIGRALRTTLSFEEFDAVIAHELSHVANRHIHKRLIDLLRNFISVILGISVILLLLFAASFLYWGEDAYIHSTSTTLLGVALCMSWFIFNYSILFDTIRSHEFEADGYAVMVLGAKLEAFKSAIQKLTTTDELPEYIRRKANLDRKKGPLSCWLAKNFSTHPDTKFRISFLEYKISHGLPFNHYISTPQKVRNALKHLLEWRFLIPLSSMLVLFIAWTIWNFNSGMELITFINQSPRDAIIRHPLIAQKINSKPQLVGQTLMYYVVKRRDEVLINHFIAKGAEKGKTLIYISQLKDFSLFKKYYELFQAEVSEDEYFLVLRKTAQVNFTDGYRLLVNAKRFEGLHPSYKEDVARLHSSKTRAPASILEK
jgi:Zn-dependent protease with chaperone function